MSITSFYLLYMFIGVYLQVDANPIITNNFLSQIEYLQEINRSLEQRIDGLARNQELRQELTEIDQLAQQLEKDKEMVLETADMELQEAKKEMQRQQRELENLEEVIQMRASHGMSGKEQSPSHLDAFVKSLEEERNYYKQELERYRLLRGRTDKSPTPSPGRGRNGDAEFSHALKERDELQSMLLGFEKHMEDIQTRVKLLTAERDQLSSQYQQAQEELRRVQRALESSELQHRIRDDREQTEAELQRVTAERDALRDRLKVKVCVCKLSFCFFYSGLISNALMGTAGRGCYL
uniref:Uncharacterized protein n=1 Tax=Sinocyclocheilus anshuiensis TaxID=1608454 RepID=A0A671PR97_9TELE